MVDQAAFRAADLVRRLLTFSRKSEVKAEPTNVNRVVDEVVGLLQRTIPKMIDLQTRLAPDLPDIIADRVQIEQILMNLATNAVDAMGESGTLLVETEEFTVPEGYQAKYRELRPGEYVLLKVSDTGCGMDEETRGRIFEPFFTTKELGKGTGLGLATTYGIVRAHNGHIACYSEPGSGTTFKVFLPVQAFEPGRESAVEPRMESAAGGTETILVADDEEPLLDLAEEVLTRHGYSVLKARSGEEALEIYGREGEGIQLIIMDLGMPGKGGYASLQELLELRPRPKVIIASGYSAHPLAGDPKKHGVAAFLHKPYRLNEMVRTVRATLDP